jgi:hypothetical protein
MLNYPLELNSKIGYLVNGVDSGDAAPPQQDWDLYGVYRKQVADLTSQWESIVSTDLANLNHVIQRENIPMITPSAAIEAKAPAAREEHSQE